MPKPGWYLTDLFMILIRNKRENASQNLIIVKYLFSVFPPRAIGVCQQSIQQNPVYPYKAAF